MCNQGDRNLSALVSNSMMCLKFRSVLFYRRCISDSKGNKANKFVMLSVSNPEEHNKFMMQFSLQIQRKPKKFMMQSVPKSKGNPTSL
jgi:hypothetical protein